MNLAELQQLPGVVFQEDNAISPDYDGFEVWPIRDLFKDQSIKDPQHDNKAWGIDWDKFAGMPDDNDKPTCFEPCEPEEAELWCVYAHLVQGGLECIADCDTEVLAEKVAAELTILQYETVSNLTH